MQSHIETIRVHERKTTVFVASTDLFHSEQKMNTSSEPSDFEEDYCVEKNMNNMCKYNRNYNMKL